MFGDEPVWLPEYIDEFHRDFVQRPDKTKRSFYEKLAGQLSESRPEVKKLASEMFWVMMLCPLNIGAKKKREGIGLIWNWSGDELDLAHPMLQDDVLAGIGSAGTGYNTQRYREVTYFIEVLKRFFAADQNERERLLNDGWQFSQWLEKVPGSNTRQLRHMLLYLLFPDGFERIFGRKHQREILEKLKGIPRKKYQELPRVEVDRLLWAIRQEKIEEFGTEELDFYNSPLKELWWPRDSKTYLLAWNPAKWNWESFESDRNATAAGKKVIHKWSCTNGKAAVGDKAYLVRVGTDPRGIIAVGNIVKAPYEVPHYDETKAAAGERQMSVDVEFSQIRDPRHDAYVTEEDLNSISAEGQVWWPQQSGIEIKDKSAADLDANWDKLARVVLKEKQVLSGKSKNLILYGPPGTGKTYRLNQMRKDYTAQPSGASADEHRDAVIAELGWRDVVVASLFDMGESGTVNQIATHPYLVSKARSLGRKKNVRAGIWGVLQQHARLESETVNYARRRAPYIFDKDSTSKWMLVGDWREECAPAIEAVDQLKGGKSARAGPHLQRYVYVTFHQAYSYEDFVEGIRPQVSEGDDAAVSYSVEPGVFRRICQRARNDPSHRYAIFIDEINRGNIAKILGELITLLEPDKRAIYDEEGELVDGMELTLPYSGDRFSVPANLDVIGTMNSADRSIALLDTALRRRFRFQEMMPDSRVITGSDADGMIPDGEGDKINLRLLLDAINERMRFLLHRDQSLGHAYFTAVADFPALKDVFIHQVIPLLQEYFYDDWRRIQLVFRDVEEDGSPAESQIICHKLVKEEDILGFNHDDYEDSYDYWVAADVDITPDAIRKIYETE